MRKLGKGHRKNDRRSAKLLPRLRGGVVAGETLSRRSPPDPGQGLHRLLDLPLIGFVDYCAEDLLNPHRHLPAYLLLFGVCAAPQAEGR
jgi:hypothetical protein